jgi:hypothetical protein
MLNESEFSSHVNKVCVYIAEAHALDEWPVPSARFNEERGVVSVTQPKLLEERLQLANEFRTNFNLPADMRLLVDHPQNEIFEKTYSPWPMRVFLVDEEEKFHYISSPDGCSFERIFERLRRHLVHVLDGSKQGIGKDKRKRI